VTIVKKLFLNKIREIFLFAHVHLDHIQHLIMIVQIVWRIVKLALMRLPATLANQHPPRQCPEYFPIVIALYIISASQIMTVYLVWINVRPAPIKHLVTFVKKLLLNKTQENSLYVLVLQDLTQLQTIIVLIVWKIARLVQMRPPVTLANQHPLRQCPEYFPIVIALYIILVNQITTVYHV
jgi:hypothetical protein